MQRRSRFASIAVLAIAMWATALPAFAADPPSMQQAMATGTGFDRGWYASGTSQSPFASPMDMWNWRKRGWLLMFSGQTFGVYSNQTGPRGRDKLFSTDWAMLMASHKVGPGTLTIRSMVSLEQLTITNRRYPLLFQVGETANGVPIINGQHPHDLFMELAASYQFRLGERTTLNLYAGPRGEPALGPPAFPHRQSTSENPVAVLAHHYQDSTHISTNVLTAGISHGPLTLEASGFHGGEPDEKRWGIEGGAIDSFSTRLTVTPFERWAAQFSIGRINNREITHPLRDTLRTSASVSYVRPLATGRWATTLIWGRNRDLPYTALPGVGPAFPRAQDALTPRHIVSVPTREPGQTYNSYLIESTVRFGFRNWIWGRVENLDRDSTLLYEESPLLLLVDETRFARVQAYTVGYEREISSPLSDILHPALGAQWTLFHAPPNLQPVYGANSHGVQIFLRLRAGQAPR